MFFRSGFMLTPPPGGIPVPPPEGRKAPPLQPHALDEFEAVLQRTREGILTGTDRIFAYARQNDESINTGDLRSISKPGILHPAAPVSLQISDWKRRAGTRPAPRLSGCIRWKFLQSGRVCILTGSRHEEVLLRICSCSFSGAVRKPACRCRFFSPPLSFRFQPALPAGGVLR